MATPIRKIKFYCSDDCVQSGCPSHIAEMGYQSTSDILFFRDREDLDFEYWERGSLRAFLTLLAEIGKVRVEVAGEIESCYKKLKEADPTQPKDSR